MHILGDSFFFCLLMVSLMYESTLCYMHVHCTSWGDIHTHCVFNSPPKVSMSFQTKIKPAGVKTHGLSLTYIKKNYIVTK